MGWGLESVSTLPPAFPNWMPKCVVCVVGVPMGPGPNQLATCATQHLVPSLLRWHIFSIRGKPHLRPSQHFHVQAYGNNIRKGQPCPSTLRPAQLINLHSQKANSAQQLEGLPDQSTSIHKRPTLPIKFRSCLTDQPPFTKGQLCPSNSRPAHLIDLHSWKANSAHQIQGLPEWSTSIHKRPTLPVKFKACPIDQPLFTNGQLCPSNLRPAQLINLHSQKAKSTHQV